MYLYKTELLEIELFISVKIDLVLNNLQRYIWYKTKPNQTKPESKTVFDVFVITEPSPSTMCKFLPKVNLKSCKRDLNSEFFLLLDKLLHQGYRI